MYSAESQPTHTTSTPTPLVGDARSARILAKTIYRELRQSGLNEKEVLAIASEMLGLIAEEVRGS